MKLPDSEIVLKARIKDPENDIVTCFWSLKTYPSGANIIFENSGLPETKVSGLSIPGKYIFNLTTIDRTKFTSRDIIVLVQ